VHGVLAETKTYKNGKKYLTEQYRRGDFARQLSLERISILSRARSASRCQIAPCPNRHVAAVNTGVCVVAWPSIHPVLAATHPVDIVDMGSIE
jgi:hypothetical protein